jgi:uncharacterized membrane protein
MNTVFKFYNAVWVMLALASAALIVRMSRESGSDHHVAAPVPGTPGSTAPVTANAAAMLEDKIPDVVSLLGPGEAGVAFGSDERVTGESAPDAANRHQEQRPRRWTTAWAWTGLVIAGIAIVAALAYPLIATGIRLDQRFPQGGRTWTLNALDWMNYGQIDRGGVVLAYDEDRAVIEWFNTEVPGAPVIAEASLGAYMCSGSRISIHTGLPVVVGWNWHETQQRGWTDLAQRQADLETLYTSEDPEEKRRVIEKYRIEYIVIGDLERVYPLPDCTVRDNEAGIAAFDSMVGEGLEVAFQAGDTVVYRVTGA